MFTCKTCSSNTYRSTPCVVSNTICSPCTVYNSDSFVELVCTPTRNTVCRLRSTHVLRIITSANRAFSVPIYSVQFSLSVLLGFLLNDFYYIPNYSLPGLHNLSHGHARVLSLYRLSRHNLSAFRPEDSAAIDFTFSAVRTIDLQGNPLDAITPEAAPKIIAHLMYVESRHGCGNIAVFRNSQGLEFLCWRNQFPVQCKHC